MWTYVIYDMFTGQKMSQHIDDRWFTLATSHCFIVFSCTFHCNMLLLSWESAFWMMWWLEGKATNPCSSSSERHQKMKMQRRKGAKGPDLEESTLKGHCGYLCHWWDFQKMHWKTLIRQKRDAAENPEVYEVQADSEHRMPEGGNRKVLLQIFKEVGAS